MRYVAILSNDPKVGSISEQRAAFSAGVDQQIFEVPHKDREFGFSKLALREGDVLLIAHARVLGYLSERSRLLKELADRGVFIQLPGGEPVLYDSEEKKADFHAKAKAKTGRPSVKQKRLRGRPVEKTQPSQDVKNEICDAWHEVNPETGKRMRLSYVLELAKKRMKRDVARHEIKHWCGDKRGERKE